MTANISFVHDRHLAHSTTSIVGESQALVDILQKIVHNAGALLEVRNCSVALLDSIGSTLVTLAALQTNGHKLRRTRFHLNEGVAGWVAEHRKALVINNVELDPRFKPLGAVPVGSIMCVPLMDDGNFIGTLTASSPEINAFNEARARMLSIFADQAVLAIINARHAESAQRQARQLEMLIHLARGITTRLEPEALYRTILTTVLRLLTCNLAVVYLYQEDTQELCPVAEWSGDSMPAEREPKIHIFPPQTSDKGEQREKIGLYSTNSLIAWAAMHQHPMLRGPMQYAQDMGNSPLSPSHNAELAAPFVSKEDLYGVLYLQRAEPFSSEELRLMRNLSNMVAAALENVKLFHRVRTDREQLRAILTSSSDGIALLGINACFLEVNAAFARIFDVEPQQVIGMACQELFGCRTQNGPQSCNDLCMIHHALQQAQPLPYTEVDLHIHDMPRTLGVSITPVSATDIPLCLLIARDVTALREATRAKARFLSMITHELRSPLNSINGYLDLTLTGVGGELNEQQREFVRRARTGSELLYALLEDLLVISRADAGELHLNRDVTSLPDIIADAVEEMELTASDNDIAIRLDIAKNLPLICVDAVRLQQVVRNLLSNALRFTSPGGQVTIAAWVENMAQDPQETASDAGNNRVVIQVSDTGCGISPDFHQRIFERFYQIPNPSSGRSGGQGLGLTIVKMLVELHGGYVTVESTPGQGSKFTNILPCLFL
ncbi:MAG: GAF domain-containing protein [Chloroflexi bacterium]|nr:GAF domain-containing protein [Chloroflexota bacterium]